MKKEERLLFRIGFMHAQVSGIFGALKHIMRGTEEQGDSRASLAYVKTEVGDLIVQIHLLCEQLNLNYKECEKLGWDRYNELKEIWDSRGYGDKWA
jgi:hypothetical protein